MLNPNKLLKTKQHEVTERPVRVTSVKVGRFTFVFAFNQLVYG